MLSSRTLPTFLLTVFTVLTLTACATPPASVQLLAEHPNFQTPESAGRSFLAALSCDNARTEYLCMAEGLKREYGATFDKWLATRGQVLSELGGAVKHAHRLKPVSAVEQNGGTLVSWVYGPHELQLLMTSQDYWGIETLEGEQWGAFLSKPIGETLTIKNRKLSIELSDSILRGFPAQTKVSRFIIETEWKVLGIDSADSP